MPLAGFFIGDAPSRHIAERQRKFPPIYEREAGAWQALFSVALDLSTPALRNLAARGLIASGEIGELTPSTYVSRRGKGYAIEMHSGQMRLLYSAARAMTASDAGRFREDKSGALSISDVAKQVADLFRNYESKGIATVQLFSATPYQRSWADNIAFAAERFLLLHELAHIHNGDLALWRSILGVERTGPEVERAADATACEWLTQYVSHPTPNGPQRQLLYAGAEFSLRVRMAIERTASRKFNPTHPPAGDRVAAIRERLRSAVGAGTFYAIANTSIAFDQMWRAIELAMHGKDPEFKPELDDVSAGLWVLTVEFIKAGRQGVQFKGLSGEPGRKQIEITPVNDSQEAMVQSARADFRDIPQDLRDAVERQAGEIFAPGSIEFSLFIELLHSSAGDGKVIL
jgi:hypothetical protein